MMDFKKLNEYALETARNELTNHFDWNAFVVYSMAVSNLNNASSNDIEGTEIDDNIKHIFDDFIKYYDKKNNGKDSIQELGIMMNTLKRIIFEVYYQATAKEKQIVVDCISSINHEFINNNCT